MNIKIMNESCAKITVEPYECCGVGISYDSFSPDSIQARLFFASVISRLEAMDFISCRSDKISAEVFERSDGGLVIYVSVSQKKSEPTENFKRTPEVSSAIVCENPQEAAAFAAAAAMADAEAALYKYENKYALISDKAIEGWSNDRIEIAKISEYWEKLCDNAVERLTNL